MNLNDEQRQSLNTLPVGTMIVRLADEFPEPFLVKVPLFRVREGGVCDDHIRVRMAGDSGAAAAGFGRSRSRTASSIGRPAGGEWR